MNYSFRILLIPVLLTGLTLCFISCKPKPTLAVVTTANVTGTTQTTATSGGNVTDDGNVEVRQEGSAGVLRRIQQPVPVRQVMGQEQVILQVV